MYINGRKWHRIETVGRKPLSKPELYIGCSALYEEEICPITRLNRPTWFQKIKAPKFLEISLMHWSPLPQGLSWYSFLEAESTPGHRKLSDAKGKIPGDTGNLSRDLPTCSAMP
jgi:hypothetical protein